VLIGAACCASLAAITPASVRGSAPADAELDLACCWLSGSFTSGEQAAADSNYYDIRLHMAGIWPGPGDGRWLYVEQAVADSQERPYRQRVYHLHRISPEFLASDVYLLPGPGRFVGAWRDPARLEVLSPDSLTLRDGCTIQLKRRPDGAFVGATRDRACSSELRGAAYATSEVELTAETLTSWDRGFDTDGRQVWGATEGGYVFKRVQAVGGGAGGDAEAAKEAMLAADREFSQLSVAEGMAAAFERFADAGATVFREGRTPISGREAIGGHFAGGAEAILSWEPYFAEIGASGDLGYTLGRWLYETQDGEGHPETEHGYYITIWKKQSDGTWKYVFDTGITSEEPFEEP
jgi:CpeT protein